MEYINTYKKTLELSGDYSENTVQAYTSDLKRFFQFLEDRTDHKPHVGDVNSEVIKDFLEHEKNAGFSASTLHRRKVSLGQFLLYLSRTGNFSKKEVSEVLGWKQKLWKEIYSRDVQFLSETDLDRLSAVLWQEKSAKAVRDRAIIFLSLETGLTIGKIISINLSDLDLDNEMLIISNKGPNRMIPIHKSTEFLRMYLDAVRKEFTQSTTEDALFVSQMGGRISRQGVWQMVKEWGQKANLLNPLSPRILRNTTIKKMVHAGLPTAEIQKRLGHINRYSTRALVRKIKRIA